MEKILIIEDERDIAASIEYNLTREGYRVFRAYNGHDGLKMLKENLPSLVILDLMLPGIDGLEVCRQAKKDPKTAMIPIIILTAKSEEIDKVVGLEIGADDYIVKPFSMKELIVRVKVALRRNSKEKGPKQLEYIKAGTLEIDLAGYGVKVAGKQIELTAKEFQLLAYLAGSQDKVFSREQILRDVWQIDVPLKTHTVEVHIKKLRDKLGKAGDSIVNLHGIGYKFKG